jgi:twitching motility protein PilT
MEEGKQQYGMQTFDQHLMELVNTNQVEYETAKYAASNPADFELRMKTLGQDELVQELI